jgi:hypothetical protein
MIFHLIIKKKLFYENTASVTLYLNGIVIVDCINSVRNQVGVTNSGSHFWWEWKFFQFSFCMRCIDLT